VNERASEDLWERNNPPLPSAQKQQDGHSLERERRMSATSKNLDSSGGRSGVGNFPKRRMALPQRWRVPNQQQQQQEQEKCATTTASPSLLLLLPTHRRRLVVHLLLVLLGCSQNALLGGLVYGWASFSATIATGDVSVPVPAASAASAASSRGGVAAGASATSGAVRSATGTTTTTAATAAVGGGGGMGLSLQQSTMIFTVASSLGGTALSPLLLGYVLDAHGPRTCSVLSHAFILTGCQLLACVRPPPPPQPPRKDDGSAAAQEGEDIDNSRFALLCALAMSLIGFGGPGIQLSIVSYLTNLFASSGGSRRSQFLVLSLVNGSVSLSFAVLAFFGYIYERQRQLQHMRESSSIQNASSSTIVVVTYRELFAGLSALVVVSMVASILCWPDDPHQAHTSPTTSTASEGSQSVPAAATASAPLPRSSSSSNDDDGDNTASSAVSMPTAIEELPSTRPRRQNKTLSDGTKAMSPRTSMTATPEGDFVLALSQYQHVLQHAPLDSYLRTSDDDSSNNQYYYYYHHDDNDDWTEHGGKAHGAGEVLERHESFVLSRKALESGLPHLVSWKDAPFWAQLTSGPYVRGNVFFAVTSFVANLYVASITIEVRFARLRIGLDSFVRYSYISCILYTVNHCCFLALRAFQLNNNAMVWIDLFCDHPRFLVSSRTGIASPCRSRTT
jgi:hypothetical protein